MSSYFPDVNVWVAIASEAHMHHSIAMAWLEGVDSSVFFCRFTQLGFLRLMTNPIAMRGEVKTQVKAWQGYDRLLGDDRILFRVEPDPEELGDALRKLTSKQQHSFRDWPDAYLLAFSQVVGLTLVTFDRGLRKLAGDHALLLSSAR